MKAAPTHLPQPRVAPPAFFLFQKTNKKTQTKLPIDPKSTNPPSKKKKIKAKQQKETQKILKTTVKSKSQQGQGEPSTAGHLRRATQQTQLQVWRIWESKEWWLPKIPNELLPPLQNLLPPGQGRSGRLQGAGGKRFPGRGWREEVWEGSGDPANGSWSAPPRS